jgi:hypothetical protein
MTRHELERDLKIIAALNTIAEQLKILNETQRSLLVLSRLRGVASEEVDDA